MAKLKKTLLSIFLFLNLSISCNSQEIPSSFADLAEKLMPSVVNISTTTTITTQTNPFPFQFPPGSPFEDMFKEFGAPQERKSSALGSGFIIDEKGIVITNNHVIQGAEDIIVRVNGDKELNNKTNSLLEEINLKHCAHIPAGLLSYADQRALEIGITIAGGAETLMLDEPTAGMSNSETERAVNLIKQISEKRTLVVVEHDMGVVFDLADRISVLVYGEIIATDTPKKIRENKAVQEAYLGTEDH